MIESLRVKSYRSWKVDDVSGPVARERLARLELFDEMRAEGCSMTLCLKAIKWSRATYYRWQKRYREQGVHGLENRSRRPRRARRRCWTPDDETRVLALRDAQPLWSKRKIGAALRLDVAEFECSDSTVGRILKRAMARGRIRPAAQAAGRAKPKRPRAFKHHAKRWQYGMRAAAPGELVQIDHMSVSFPGTSVKNFTAVCPTTGYLTAHAYSRATSHNAARFLEQVLHAMPFAIHSIQVDGGSEFRAAFEHACQQHYCHHRPHGGKHQNFQTPMAYYQSLKQAA